MCSQIMAAHNKGVYCGQYAYHKLFYFLLYNNAAVNTLL